MPETLTNKQRAVFLDRDGVLNTEGGYVTTPEGLNLLPGAAEAVARLRAAGWLVIVFTNQAGVGRGLMTLDALGRVHERLHEAFRAAGGALNAIYFCPHHPDEACECRKPLPGMLHQVAREHQVDLSASYAIGDSPRDIAAGRAAGCQTLLVLTGHTREYDPASFPDPQPDRVFPDLASAAAWLTESRD